MNNWTAEGVDKDHKPIKIQYKNEKVELTELFNKAIRLAESDVEDQNAIRQLGMGWVADEAVAIAIYCSLKYKDNFEDAIVAAANHDGDSDSTAAITGNIVGARVGYKNIPDYYKNYVELKDIKLPEEMQRVIARVAEAERERRAAIISAEGEKASAAAVAEAASLLAQTPGGLNIRTLQTLEKISTDPSQKTVILLPSDLACGLKNLFK